MYISWFVSEQENNTKVVNCLSYDIAFSHYPNSEEMRSHFRYVLPFVNHKYEHGHS